MQEGTLTINENTTQTEPTVDTVFPKRRPGRPKRTSFSSDPLKTNHTQSVSDHRSSNTYEQIAKDYYSKSGFGIEDIIKNPNPNFHYRKASIAKLQSQGIGSYPPGYEICKEEELKNEFGMKSPDSTLRFGDTILVRQPMELHNALRKEKHKRMDWYIDYLKQANELKKVKINGSDFDAYRANVGKVNGSNFSKSDVGTSDFGAFNK